MPVCSVQPSRMNGDGVPGDGPLDVGRPARPRGRTGRGRSRRARRSRRGGAVGVLGRRGRRCAGTSAFTSTTSRRSGSAPARCSSSTVAPACSERLQVPVGVGRRGDGGHHPGRMRSRIGAKRGSRAGTNSMSAPASTQEPLGRAEEPAEVADARLREHLVEVDEQRAEDLEVLPVVARRERVQERAGLAGAERDPDVVGCPDPGDRVVDRGGVRRHPNGLVERPRVERCPRRRGPTGSRSHSRSWWPSGSCCGSATCSSSRPKTLGFDAIWYELQSQTLSHGDGYIDPDAFFRLGERVPTANFPPLWPLLLAGANQVGLDTERAHQMVGCVLGSITVALTGVIGRRVAGRRVGIVAAAIVAVSPMLIAADGSLMAESLYITPGRHRGADRVRGPGPSIVVVVRGARRRARSRDAGHAATD